MGYQFGARSLQNLQGVHPNLQKVLKEAIKTSPVDFTVTEGVRTAKRQAELYAQGRTKPGQRVTNVNGTTSKSNHQVKYDGYGHAVDLYPFFLGQVQVHHKDTIKNLEKIAIHIKATAKCLGIPITWGGDWKSPFDPPHFELK